MIISKENPSLEFEKIKKYILDNNVTDLYDSVKIVQDNIDKHFEFPVLDMIDLCLECLSVTDTEARKSTINILKTVRKGIVGDKYDYLKSLQVED